MPKYVLPSLSLNDSIYGSDDARTESVPDTEDERGASPHRDDDEDDDEEDDEEEEEEEEEDDDDDAAVFTETRGNLLLVRQQVNNRRLVEQKKGELEERVEQVKKKLDEEVHTDDHFQVAEARGMNRQADDLSDEVSRLQDQKAAVVEEVSEMATAEPKEVERVVDKHPGLKAGFLRMMPYILEDPREISGILEKCTGKIADDYRFLASKLPSAPPAPSQDVALLRLRAERAEEKTANLETQLRDKERASRSEGVKAASEASRRGALEKELAQVKSAHAEERAASDREAEALRARKEKYKTKAGTLRENMAIMEDTVTQHQEASDAAKEALEECGRQLELKEQEATRLSEELDKLLRADRDNHSKLTSVENMVTRLRGEKARDKAGHLKALRAAKDEAQQKEDDLRGQCGDLQDAQRTVQRQLDRTRESVQRLELEVKDREARLNSHGQELNNARARSNEHMRDAQAKASEIRDLKNRLHGLEMKKYELEEACQAEASEVSDLDNKLGDKESQNDRLKSAVSDLDNKLKAKAAELDTSVDSARIAAETAKDNQKRAMEHQVALEGRVTELTRDLDASRSAKKAADAKAEMMREQRDAQRALCVQISNRMHGSTRALQLFLAECCHASPEACSELASEIQQCGAIQIALRSVEPVGWTILDSWTGDGMAEKPDLPLAGELITLVLDLFKLATSGAVATWACQERLRLLLQAVSTCTETSVHAQLFGPLFKVVTEAVCSRPGNFEIGLVFWQVLTVLEKRWIGSPKWEKQALEAYLEGYPEYAQVGGIVIRDEDVVESDDCHFFSREMAVVATEDASTAVLIHTGDRSVRFFAKDRWVTEPFRFVVKAEAAGEEDIVLPYRRENRDMEWVLEHI